MDGCARSPRDGAWAGTGAPWPWAELRAELSAPSPSAGPLGSSASSCSAAPAALPLELVRVTAGNLMDWQPGSRSRLADLVWIGGLGLVIAPLCASGLILNRVMLSYRVCWGLMH